MAWTLAGVAFQAPDREGKMYWAREDPFPCDRWCAEAGKLQPDLQERRRCTLPQYKGKWGKPAGSADARLYQWVGRGTDYSDPNLPNRMPAELECEGCPGGWSRGGFADSFQKYVRRRLDTGAHDQNPIIGPDTPDHILAALRLYEGYEAAAAAETRRKIDG